jgi:hypothetical protein
MTFTISEKVRMSSSFMETSRTLGDHGSYAQDWEVALRKMVTTDKLTM